VHQRVIEGGRPATVLRLLEHTDSIRPDSTRFDSIRLDYIRFDSITFDSIQ